MIAACDLPVLVDADNGYGDVKNAAHLLNTNERTGPVRGDYRRSGLAETMRPYGRQASEGGG